MEEQRLKQIKDSIDQVKKDSIAEVERIEQARLDSIKNAKETRENVYRAYHNILYDISKGKSFGTDYNTLKDIPYIGDAGSYCNYFLYDITKDGIPELWVDYGGDPFVGNLGVFTCLDGQSKLIYETGSSTSWFYEGKDYILKVYNFPGFEAYWNKLTYGNGKIVEKEIFRERPHHSSDDYTTPKEKPCKMYSYTNTQPI